MYAVGDELYNFDAQMNPPRIRVVKKVLEDFYVFPRRNMHGDTKLSKSYIDKKYLNYTEAKKLHPDFFI